MLKEETQGEISEMGTSTRTNYMSPTNLFGNTSVATKALMWYLICPVEQVQINALR